MTDSLMIHFIFYLFIAFSSLAFALFAYDKHLAHYGLRRIPESLLIASAIPGGFGALVAMILFRHKTLKSKFTIWVPILACLDVAILVVVDIYMKYM